MPDRNGYPTEAELKEVGIHPLDTKDDIEDFIDFLKEIWWEPEGGVRLNSRGKNILKIELHTHGWSGNESIVEEMSSSCLANMFWIRFWRCTMRGGHYYFRINLDTLKES